jgi:hypothetical protein
MPWCPHASKRAADPVNRGDVRRLFRSGGDQSGARDRSLCAARLHADDKRDRSETKLDRVSHQRFLPFGRQNAERIALTGLPTGRALMIEIVAILEPTK